MGLSYAVLGNSPNVGGDNNMAVIMAIFKPDKVQCRGNFDTSSSCQHVLADMPARADPEVFGPRGTPFVDEFLPQEVVSGK